MVQIFRSYHTRPPDWSTQKKFNLGELLISWSHLYSKTMLRRAFISLKTVTKLYVFNSTCKKGIYLLNNLSAPWRRVDGKKEEYVHTQRSAWHWIQTPFHHNLQSWQGGRWCQSIPGVQKLTLETRSERDTLTCEELDSFPPWETMVAVWLQAAETAVWQGLWFWV